MTVLPNLNTLTPDQQSQAAELGQNKDETVTTAAEPADATIPTETTTSSVETPPAETPSEDTAPPKSNEETQTETPTKTVSDAPVGDTNKETPAEEPANPSEAASQTEQTNVAESSHAAVQNTETNLAGATIAPSSNTDATVQGTTTATANAPTQASVPGNPTVAPALTEVDGTASAQPVMTPIEREAAANGTTAPTLIDHALEAHKTYASKNGTATNGGLAAVTVATTTNGIIQPASAPNEPLTTANPAPPADDPEVKDTVPVTNSDETDTVTSTTILDTDDDNVKSLKTQLVAFSKLASAPGTKPEEFQDSAKMISQITNFIINNPKNPVLDTFLAFFRENIKGVCNTNEYMKGCTLLDNGSQQKIGYLWTLFSNLATKTPYKINSGLVVHILKKIDIISYYNRQQAVIAQGGGK